MSEKSKSKVGTRRVEGDECFSSSYRRVLQFTIRTSVAWLHKELQNLGDLLWFELKSTRVVIFPELVDYMLHIQCYRCAASCNSENASVPEQTSHEVLPSFFLIVQ